MDFATSVAQRVMHNRSLATDKSNRYKYRLLLDKFAAQYEDMLITKANEIIARNARWQAEDEREAQWAKELDLFKPRRT